MPQSLPSSISLSASLPYNQWITACKPLFEKLRERGTPSGVVGMPHAYFATMANRDYSRPDLAVFREFYQNSIDAGARNIGTNIFPSDSSDSSGQLMVEDDGCGMDETVLRERLLVLGGSHKQAGSVGMFGKAKEVLYFAWECYLIHTRNYLIIGQGAVYDIYHLPSDLHRKGTASIVKFWDNAGNYAAQEFQDKSIPHFVSIPFLCSRAVNYVVENSVIRNVRFTFNNQKITCARQERLVATVAGCMDIRRRESRPDESPQIHVRAANGLWMFSVYVPQQLRDIGYQAIYPLGTSIESFTSNRDALKGTYLDIFDAYKQKIFNSPEISQRHTIEKSDALSCVHSFMPTVSDNYFKDDNEKDKLARLNVKIEGKEKTACRKFFSNKRAVRVFMALAHPIFNTALEAFHELHPTWNSSAPDLGVIFSSQAGGQHEKNKGKDLIYINPSSFNFRDLSVPNLSVIAACLHYIVAHELAHLIHQGHDSNFTAEEYAIYRKMAEREPHLAAEAIEKAFEAIQPSGHSRHLPG